jgi:hypothetical protein
MNKDNMIDIAYEKIKKMRESGYKFLGYPVYDVSKRDLGKLMSIANKYGIPFGWLVNLIKHETASTFNPEIKNSIGASGLIQFMTQLYDRNKKAYVKMYYSKADGSGRVDTDALRKMSFYDQLDYVDGFLNKNLKRYLVDGKIPNNFSQGDIFMTIFYPVSVGKPDFRFPDTVSKANAGIRTPMDYVERALRKPIFSLEDIPYKLADVKKKFGEVFEEIKEQTTEIAKKNYFPLILVLVGISGLGYYLVKSKIIKI